MSEIVDWRALDQHVLVVAVKRIPGEWCAYIKDTPGMNHEAELEEVRAWGSKLPKEIAEAVFSNIYHRLGEVLPYAH